MKQLVKEAYEYLSEAGLIIDRSSGKAYPKSDQILIMALKQNEMRERRIDPNMLEDFHIGVAETFSEVIGHTDEWKKVIDGDIWIVFNKKGVDIQTIPVARQDKKDPRKIKVKMSLDYSKESPYFAVHMKEKGKPARKWEDIGEAILKKILEYVPKSVRGIK